MEDKMRHNKTILHYYDLSRSWSTNPVIYGTSMNWNDMCIYSISFDFDDIWWTVEASLSWKDNLENTIKE